MLLAGNVLFGTASQGGAGGGGTVFKLNTNGLGFTAIHSFTNSDGKTPAGDLLLSGNTLYGTTCAGGSSGNGTVFEVNTDGSGFATVYSFTNGDGAKPSAGLLLSGGALYGTTQNGGAGGAGTVFEVNTNGVGFTNLYNFTALVSGTNLDGANPYAGLVLSDGYVYGTACYGGSADDGALFALSLVEAPPWLDIQFHGPGTAISWPSCWPDWTLQQCTNLMTANWRTNGLTVFDDGTNRTVTIPSPTGNLFFRLAK